MIKLEEEGLLKHNRTGLLQRTHYIRYIISTGKKIKMGKNNIDGELQQIQQTGSVSNYCNRCFDNVKIHSSHSMNQNRPCTSYNGNDCGTMGGRRVSSATSSCQDKSQSTPNLRSGNNNCAEANRPRNNYWGYTYEYGRSHWIPYFGHHRCSTYSSKLVPRHMGWLWHMKPGAIAKPVKELMQNFLVNYPLDTIPNTKFRTTKIVPITSSGEVEEEQPMFKVQRKGGEYFITMRPMKKRNTLEENYNPYLNCAPISLKLTRRSKCPKPKRIETITEENDEYEGETAAGEKASFGSYPCPCEEEMNVTLLPSEGTESDLSLEFTPPLPKRDKGKLPDKHETGTQYNCDDFILKFIPKDEKIKKKVMRKPQATEKKKGGKSGKGKKGK